MQAGVTSAQLPGPMHMLLNITQCLKWRLSLFLYKVMIQEQEKYVINYNSMILFQLVQFFFDISVVFVCMQDPSSVGIK